MDRDKGVDSEKDFLGCEGGGERERELCAPRVLQNSEVVEGSTIMIVSVRSSLRAVVVLDCCGWADEWSGACSTFV